MPALVTGGTGFVGRRLLAKLDQPVVVSRDAAKAAKKLEPLKPKVIRWDPLHDPLPAAALSGVDAIFHLAGDPVAEGRWTEKKKQRIRDSRVLGTQNLVAGLAAAATRPKTLISASAVGYYGDCGDAEIDERSPPGHDFLAEVCIGWERAALTARDLGIRVVLIRTGVVLGEKGGALAKMLTPFQLGLGSPLGSGNQYMPWIHIDDLVELMLFAAREPPISGPLNGTAPHPVTNREFTKTLGHVLGRPTFMPAVPPLALKILLGGFGQVLLDSQRALPHAALAAGFAFHYPELEGALRELLAK
ncbi:MAG TPA: TIGR01777 family oxidoreductase [Pirellulaceae bacterium]|jgi:hypothetical protein